MRAIDPPDFQIPGISQAILVADSGLVFLSGHVALGPDGVIGTDIPTQLEQIFKNMNVTLREAGTDFSNLVKLTIYVKDYDQSMLPAIRAVRNKYINVDRPPAATLLGVSALAFPELLIEVEAVARVAKP